MSCVGNIKHRRDRDVGAEDVDMLVTKQKCYEESRLVEIIATSKDKNAHQLVGLCETRSHFAENFNFNQFTTERHCVPLRSRRPRGYANFLNCCTVCQTVGVGVSVKALRAFQLTTVSMQELHM